MVPDAREAAVSKGDVTREGTPGDGGRQGMAICLRATWSSWVKDGSADERDASAVEEHVEATGAEEARGVRAVPKWVPVEGIEDKGAGERWEVWTETNCTLREGPQTQEAERAKAAVDVIKKDTVAMGRSVRTLLTNDDWVLEPDLTIGRFRGHFGEVAAASVAAMERSTGLRVGGETKKS